jgi:hypothetical protein
MIPLRLPQLTRHEYHWLRFALQCLAAIQSGSVLDEVLLDSRQYRMEIWIQSINFVLAIPLPLNKSAVQQAGKIVRDAALFDPELLDHLIHVMRALSQQLHDREPGLVRESAKELAIKAKFQANLLKHMMRFLYDKFHISVNSGSGCES